MLFKKLFLAAIPFSSLFAINTENNCPIDNAYNAPYRIEVEKSWDFLLSGSYLYWQPKEQGLEFCKVVPPQNGKISIKNADSDFRSGFKIAAASKLNPDKWNIFCEYTRLHQHSITKATAPKNGYLIPFTIFYSEADEPSEETSNHAASALNKWFFSYDMLDLNLDRSFFVGCRLIFKTSVGARGGWIDQKSQLQGFFTNLFPNQTSLIKTESLTRSSSWLIGPRIGIDTSWCLGCYWRLFGNGSFSLLYQHFSASFKQEEFTDTSALEIFAKEKIGYVNPNLDLSLGIACGTYFLKNSWNAELSLGYNFSYFWNQNLLRQFSDQILFQIETKASDLMLHGLTATIRFDF